ncbi:MAG TPA: hypothetical protein VHM91_05900 [Verrucomicrobiales bacterium]|jgi:hypothetical protein|nr:hypothetical protein [Verrucomicrobiales bacterium]
MNTPILESQFARMGARLKVVQQNENRRASGLALDVRRDDDGEFFEVRLPSAAQPVPELLVLQTDRQDRHLLLLAKTADGRKDRFLCGHDEREWFVAAVPGNASTVADAKEALKPAEVRAAQAQAGLNREAAQRRKNEAFIRQGEWFFMPAPGLVVDAKRVLHHEPIRRSGGKAHMVETLYRTGGEAIYYSEAKRKILTVPQYRALLRQRPQTVKEDWRIMQRNMAAYGRGTVRHPDHRTITLHDWHRILMNTESQAPAMQHVAFLD